jgi:hypothetical protein
MMHELRILRAVLDGLLESALRSQIDDHLTEFEEYSHEERRVAERLVSMQSMWVSEQGMNALGNRAGSGGRGGG